MFETDKNQFNSVKFRNEFLSCVYDGKTLAETCASMRVNPGALGVYMLENAEFEKQIRDAMAFRVDLMVDKLTNIDDYIDDPIMAGVISKNIQWVAGKRYRKIYGEKIDVTHTHNINIRAAMDIARERTLIHMNANLLENKDSLTDSVSVKQGDIDVLPLEKSVKDIDPLS